MSMASLVTISRLKGYFYATPEDENRIFVDFFASEQSLNVGGFFYTTCEPYKSSYLNHKVKMVVVYPYLIVSIKGASKTDANLVNLDYAVTSKSCTKVLLDGSSIMDNFNAAFHVSSYIKAIWPSLSSGSTLSYCFVLNSTLASRPCFLDANLHYDDAISQLNTFSNSHVYDVDNELFGMFLPLLLSRQRQVSTSPNCETILIDIKDNSLSLFEISRKLELLSNQLGLSFIELESRLFLIENNRLKGLSIHRDNRSLHLHSRPTNHSVDSILHTHQSASIILLTDFDSVLGSSHQQGPASAGHASSLEELLADAIQTLYEDINNKQGYESRAIFIVALTGCRARWKASTLRLFSSQLSLSTPTTTSSQPPHANSVSQHKLSSGAQSELESIRKELSLSLREQEILVNTAASLALQREEQQQWIEHMGMDQYLPMDSNDFIRQKKRVSALSFSSAAAAATEDDNTGQIGKQIIIRKKDIKRAMKQSGHVLTSPTSSASFSSSGKIASVRWEDIGGLDRVRREILDVLELPMQHPELFAPGAPMRQGVLLYGPPGTGKTLVAKAVATECNMSFLSIKGPELLDSYVGESEKNVRDIFDRARLQAPCVLFFDEVDSLAPARAKRNDSGGGVMDRIVSQLLTEMDQLFSRDTHDRSNPHKGMVFIIAATNRPDLLDPALLRPGRFDRRIYLGVSSDVTARMNILKAQTRKFVLAADIDLLAVAEQMRAQVTGADIGAVTTAAYNFALQRKLAQLREAFSLSTRHQNSNGKSASIGIDENQEEMWALTEYINQLPKSELQVVVQQDDFLSACNDMKSSVFDLAHYEELQAQFES